METPETQPEEQPRGAPRWLTLLIAVAVLAAVGGAIIVVVKTAGRTGAGPAPVSLKVMPFETVVRGFKHGMLGRVSVNVRRVNRHRQEAGTLNPHQDSLARLCDSAIARIRSRTMRLDSLPTKPARVAMMDSLRHAYDSLRALVGAFVRSVGSKEEPDQESLDIELKNLISE
jgi:hypothetical protein